MRKKVPLSTYIQLVKVYHPTAECIIRPSGKLYYQVIYEGNKPTSLLGQGKTVIEAWKAAYNNVYDH